MLTGELLVRIQATADQFRAEIAGAKKSFEDFTKKVEDNKESLRAFGIGAVAIGAGLTGLALKVGLTAARTQVLGTVMEAVGKNAGYTTEQLKEQEDKIKSLGITTQEARMSVVRFIQSQLDIADASKIARVAQDLAVISGENSSQAFATLTQAIISQHPMLLRQYGIVLTLDQVYEKYAQTIKKDVELLTEQERKQAFLNVILEAGTRVTGTYEKSMGDVGKQLSSFARYVEETANQFGKFFLPIMLKAVLMGRDFLQWLQSLPEPLKMFIALGGALTGILSLFAGTIMLAAINMGNLKLAMNGLMIASRATWAIIAANPFAALALVIAGVTLATASFIDKLIDANNESLKTGNSIKDRIALMNKEIQTMKDKEKQDMKTLQYLISQGANIDEIKKKEKELIDLKSKNSKEIEVREKALLLLKKDLAKQETAINKDKNNAILEQTRATLLKEQEIARMNMQNKLEVGSVTKTQYLALIEDQMNKLIALDQRETTEYLKLQKQKIDINNEFIRNKISILEQEMSMYGTLSDADKTAMDKRKFELDKSLSEEKITQQKYNEEILILMKDYTGKASKLSKDFAKDWETAYNLASQAGQVAADSMLNEQVTLGTAMEDAAKKSMKKYLQVKINEAIQSIALEQLKQTGIAQVSGILSFGLTLLAIPVIAAASTAAMAAVNAIMPFEQGGITTKPTLAMTSERGQREAIIPLDRLPELMERMYPSMQTINKSSTENKSISVTIIDSRMSGDPYNRRQLAITLGDILKENGAKI